MINFCARVFRACWLMTAALLVIAHSNAGAQERSPSEQRMVGTWYGEFAPSPTDPVQRFITVRRADGTFTLQARMYQAGKRMADTVNNGLWGISNGMYFTVITGVNGQPSDPKRPEAINAYLVKALEADRFDYVHVASGHQFTVRRVDPATAKLPD